MVLLLLLPPDVSEAVALLQRVLGPPRPEGSSESNLTHRGAAIHELRGQIGSYSPVGRHIAGRIAAGHSLSADPTLASLPRAALQNDELSCAMAAALGDIEALRGALRLGSRCGVSSLTAAVAHNRLHALDWLHEKGPERASHPYQLLTRDAARAGSMGALRWLVEHGAEPRADILRAALEASQDTTARWLVDAYAPACWEPAGEALCCCVHAAGSGNLPLLMLLRERGCPWDRRVASRAIVRGHLHILSWAHENGLPATDVTCQLAAESGHVHILQWARSREPPLPWSAVTCTFAAREGQLAALQWLRSQDSPCPWTSDVIAVASFGRHPALLEWARANGCPEQPRGGGE